MEDILSTGGVPEEKLTTAEQLDLAEKAQAMLLRTYIKRLKEGTISGTELGNLQRLLATNGWSLDPSQLPQELSGMLTTKLDPSVLDDDDVIPFQRKLA